MFEDTCTELGIPAGRIRLYQNYQAETAEFMGLIRCRVVIPVGQYAQGELWTVFLHELTHYKQGDIFWKYLAVLVVVTQYFNPLAWQLSRFVSQWSEYACDQRACVWEDSPIVYFRHILDMEERAAFGRVVFTSYLAKGQRELMKRVEHMKRLSCTKQKPVGMAVLTVCVLVLSESRRIYGIYGGLAGAAGETEEAAGLPVEPVELQMDDGVSDNYQVVYGQMRNIEWSVENIWWTVEGKTMLLTEVFSAQEEQTLHLSFRQSDGEMLLKNGVIMPSERRAYFTERVGLGWDIPVSELEGAGDYRFFIQNDYEASVEVYGLCGLGERAE